MPGPVLSARTVTAVTKRTAKDRTDERMNLRMMRLLELSRVGPGSWAPYTSPRAQRQVNRALALTINRRENERMTRHGVRIDIALAAIRGRQLNRHFAVDESGP
jgi:hypothetical protein